nr:unnamed protein product [Spirometra erinaceieuropaei]
MTPDDFVFSVINERLPTRHLQSVSENELQKMLDKTPEKALRQPTLFRFLGNRGLISFSEYMFLLSVLNKPKSGFEIAFKVLDIDSSGTLEFAEFSQLNKVASGAKTLQTERNSLTYFRLVCSDPKQNLTELFEKQFRTFASKEFQGVLYMTPDDFVFSVINERLPTRHLQSVSENELKKMLDKTPEKALHQPTLFRFLGNRGLISFSEYMFLLSVLNKPKSGFEIAFKVLDIDSSGTIEFAEFSQLNKVASGAKTLQTERNSLTYFRLVCRFVENLQDEILEIEFLGETSNGSIMSSEQFARILLHYTKLPESSYENFLSRLNRLSPDLELAMKMYMLANKPISLVEFKRAIKACTDEELGEGILETVFCLFDENGDGFISPNEFMVLLKNRRLRGLSKSTFLQKDRPLSLKRCIRKRIEEQS